MNQLLHNIDDVRERIMRLESAPVFDQLAWSMVFADLESAGRVSGLADARRRMETARGNQPVLFGRSPIEPCLDLLIKVDLYEKRNDVAVETEGVK